MFIKRSFDIVVSAFALLLFSPVIIAVMILVRLCLGKPIFFVQVRPGRHAVPFKMIKFRTMLEAYDEKGNPLHDSERLTKLGKILRASSLDELPGLINVLKGDMSLVGPRPLATVYLPYYTPEEYRRHEIRPGITGWAQVNGRNNLSWEEKFKLDLEYVDKQSVWLDIKILFLTVYKVFRSDGIGQGDERPLNFHETRTQKYR